MPRKPKVAVIGAGIGGLTAAVALHQRDIDVEVYEQSPQIAEIGAGVSLSPNAVKAFRALGLDAPITAIGFESDNQLVRAWNSGDVISKVFRKGVYEKEFGAPYLSAHRADLVDVLRRQLPDHVFHLGARCVGVELLHVEDGKVAALDVPESYFVAHFVGCVYSVSARATRSSKRGSRSGAFACRYRRQASMSRLDLMSSRTSA